MQLALKKQNILFVTNIGFERIICLYLCQLKK